MHRVLGWASSLTLLVACSGSTASLSGGAAQGSENGACYANATCNAGLACLSNTCVDPGDGDGGAGKPSAVDGGTSGDPADAAPDVQLRDDAGQPCPGAVINHPGTEPRGVDTIIPFVGRARDSTCGAITGAKLVWSDDREGSFGTGEMVDHKFTLKGVHTVTLTATDGLGKTSIAMVTFTLS